MLKRQNNSLNRIKQKTYLYAILSSLRKNYNLSLKECELLSNDFIRAYTSDNPDKLIDGQIFYSAVSKDEPSGKPISDCVKIRIKLTIISIDHATLSTTERCRALIYSLPWQALEQNALLTDEDLSFILNISPRTIFRIYKEYKLQKLYIPTRGNYHSFGAGQSHKSETLKLFFQGKLPNEIAFYLHHSLSSIERYIDDFSRVMNGIENNLSIEKLSAVTKLSKNVIRQYFAIYENNKNNDQILGFLRKRAAFSLKKNIFRSKSYAKIKTKRTQI